MPACSIVVGAAVPAVLDGQRLLQPSGALLRASTRLVPVQPAPSTATPQALRDQGPHLVTSLIVALGTVVVSLLIAAPAAVRAGPSRIRGRPALVFALLIVQMIPGIVMANALYTVFSKLGLIDSYLGLILADSTATIPFAILMMRAFMISMPKELIRSGRPWTAPGTGGRSRSIILPVSRNALVTAGLFSFLFAWADFLFAVTLTTGQDIEPDHRGHLPIRRQPDRRLERDHGHRRPRVDPGGRAAGGRPALRRRRA